MRLTKTVRPISLWTTVLEILDRQANGVKALTFLNWCKNVKIVPLFVEVQKNCKYIKSTK